MTTSAIQRNTFDDQHLKNYAYVWIRGFVAGVCPLVLVLGAATWCLPTPLHPGNIEVLAGVMLLCMRTSSSCQALLDVSLDLVRRFHASALYSYRVAVMKAPWPKIFLCPMLVLFLNSLDGLCVSDPWCSSHWLCCVGILLKFTRCMGNLLWPEDSTAMGKYRDSCD